MERALSLYGAPVYVRKQIVHNAHVVRDLEARGAIFVEDETEAPRGSDARALGARGRAFRPRAAAARRLNTIDATCPLVTKVHVQARRYAADGYTRRPDRTCGPRGGRRDDGEAPDATVLVESVDDAEALELPADVPLAYITQTTLSVDETTEIIDVLKRRFPHIHAPQREDICYATSNRQWAVKEMLNQIELLLVIGSGNSSNSNRLVEVARLAGVDAHLIEDETQIDERWLDDVETVGLDVGRVGAGAARRPGVRLVPGARRERDQLVLVCLRGRRVPAARRAAPSGDFRRLESRGAQAPRATGSSAGAVLHVAAGAGRRGGGGGRRAADRPRPRQPGDRPS